MRRLLLALCALAACATPPAVPPPAATIPVAPVNAYADADANANTNAYAHAHAYANGVVLPPAIAELQKRALTSSHAFDFVRSLTDEVGPRMSGSPGDKAAVAWGLRTMTSAGLANVHAEKVMVPRWVRGDERAEIVAPFARALAVAALGGSVGTPAHGVEAEIVEVDSLASLRKLAKDSLKGKIAFVDAPMRRARDGGGYGECVGARFAGPRVAAELGAVAYLLRSCGSDHDRLPHTGSKGKDDHEIPAAAISVPDAELLHRVLEHDKSARVRIALGAHTLPDVESANVVGEVPGTAKPDEIVLLGAHLDSWDLGTGAIDDGAGVGIALETGRLLAALADKPRRTVRIVLFANEEHGGAGAIGYRKAHEAEAPRHVAALEADFGGDRVYAARFLGAPEGRDRFLAVARLLAPLGVETPDEEGGSGADIAPLREIGIPSIELRQDGTHYFDWHHTANDTLDKIDPAQIAQAAAAFATFVLATANMDGDFGRVPEPKRKGRS
jgi:hypothetical protein